MTASGFVAVVGRPNVGKSSLVNALIGTKVSIVSNKLQTTRTAIRGILTRDGRQVVFVDTPGVHKPKNLLGQRLNQSAIESVDDVDLAVFVVDATKPVGGGDRFVIDRLDPAITYCVVNKSDRVRSPELLTQIGVLAPFNFREYFPVSARTGEGVDALREVLLAAMPEGPLLYPDAPTRDMAEQEWVAELVREQLLAVLREELPHSVACVVTEWEWPRVRCEIVVERNSQKGIVIGAKGAVLKEVGIRARETLPPDCFLELFVRVDPNWPNRAKSLERLGL